MFKIVGLFFMCCTYGFSQTINIDQLGKAKWLRYNGGISANSVYYNGTANRQDLTYFLRGNLNFTVAGLYNIPLSFTYSNQDFNFPNPFNFNRLSLHPSYKWATAHIGDVNMTFSPYTLAGHQFTGVGFDLAPKGRFKISAMYGRLLRATEYNAEEPKALTAYQRKGYGLKTAYDFDILKLGFIFFKASDDASSLNNSFPIELGISPKDNAVLSLESEFRVFDKAQISLTYAISGVTEDTQLNDSRTKNGILSFLLDENSSTNYYNALNASLNYPTNNGSLGVGYERIDPNYRTLGAYFFNNDLENITVNASQNLLDNSLNLSINAGLQQDNLDKSKSSEQQRIVSAINASYTASEYVTVNGSYSNFQSFTNIRDQFDYINQVGEFDTVDTLNYRQISQNANLGVNYIIKKTEAKQHSTNFNAVYQNSTNKQEGETVENGVNKLYNGSAAYTLGYTERDLRISLAANTSYNTVGENNSLTLGPTLSVGKQFFDKQLRTNFSSSYNTSYTNGEQQNDVLNFRLNGSYIWLEKHNFNLNLLMLFRNSNLNSNRDLTITLGYSYTFDNFKLNIKRGQKVPKEKEERNNERSVRFRYRDVSYNGTLTEVNEQLTNVYNSSRFTTIPSFKKDELAILLAITKEQKKEAPYKENALAFLEELYEYGDFQNTYTKVLFAAIKRIKYDMRKIDLILENSFVESKVKIDKYRSAKRLESEILEDDSVYKRLIAEHKERHLKLVGHRWMAERFASFNTLEDIEKPTGHLKEFKHSMLIRSYKMYDKNQDLKALEVFLEQEIIDLYYKRSLEIVDPEDFELRYINKN